MECSQIVVSEWSTHGPTPAIEHLTADCHHIAFEHPRNASAEPARLSADWMLTRTGSGHERCCTSHAIMQSENPDQVEDARASHNHPSTTSWLDPCKVDHVGDSLQVAQGKCPLAPVLRDDRLRRVSAVTGQCRGLVVLEADRPTTIIRDLDDPDDHVYSYKVNHYVWNPSTGQITALPKGNDSFGSWPHHHDNLGIGYDTRIRKHKLVRLYCREDLPPACEVYVLNSTGQWRPPAGAADRALPPGFATHFSSDQSIFAQGHLHWVAEPDKFNLGRNIMSFSISDEEFGIVPPPPMKMYTCQIVEIGGHLCVFNNSDEFNRSYDIWVLRDHQAGAWDLYCRIDLDTPPLSDTQLM
ncbi:hypothetical protein TRIUR3_07268 [Triticum urartu]|uniref:F-box associated beta-propeller type 3 domain-containing protein n=1 Tax=Triticum urartu TaxID=4572 RepID=M7ZPJ7_TRIUA|nr:hypothetical protein TRIUR3_07268 [Triticum urartu]